MHRDRAWMFECIQELNLTYLMLLRDLALRGEAQYAEILCGADPQVVEWLRTAKPRSIAALAASPRLLVGLRLDKAQIAPTLAGVELQGTARWLAWMHGLLARSAEEEA